MAKRNIIKPPDPVQGISKYFPKLLKTEFMDIKKGWIPERFNEVENEKFSFINIDVDIYKPTKESLDFFYPRLINGGCIHLDDYNFNEWPGARIAIKEFEKKNKISFSYEVPLGGYFLIK